MNSKMASDGNLPRTIINSPSLCIKAELEIGYDSDKRSLLENESAK
jgi:hypothetical protein